MQGARKIGKAVKIINRVADVLVSIVLVIAVLFIALRLFGFGMYDVTTGSMEPTFHVGSLIITSPTSAEELCVGDAVTFVQDGRTVTHRIVAVNAEKEQFTTRGDANNVNDAPIPFGAVIGKVVLCIPVLGGIFRILKTPVGILCAISAVSLLIVLCIIPDIFGADRKKRGVQSDGEHREK